MRLLDQSVHAFKNLTEELYSQGSRRGRCGVHLSHIKNIQMKQFSQHLLNTSKGPQIAKRTRKIPAQPGRMKERKNGHEMDPAPLDGELEDRRGSHTQRSLLTSRETSWDTQGALETWRRALHLVSGRQNRVRPTRVVCAIEMAEKAHDKMLNIMNYSRNANENYNKVLPHSSQNGHHQHNL